MNSINMLRNSNNEQKQLDKESPKMYLQTRLQTIKEISLSVSENSPAERPGKKKFLGMNS